MAGELTNINTDLGLDYNSPAALTPKFEAPATTQPTSAPITQNVNSISNTVKQPSTVSGQMTGLLEQGSKYTNLAKQGAMETAASRGLLNSSMAAGAGERAAIQSALPIAQQDASTYNQQDLANQTFQNQFASETNKAELNRQTQDQNLARQQDTLGYQANLGELTAEANTERQKDLMYTETDLKAKFQGLQQDFGLELETLKSNFDIQGNLDTSMGNMYATTLSSLAAFLNSPELSAAQQTAGAQTIIGNLQAGLNFLAGITTTPGTTT
jgi:hypothetical protein